MVLEVMFVLLLKMIIVCVYKVFDFFFLFVICVVIELFVYGFKKGGVYDMICK